jgi:hypothetical protein
LIKEFEERTRIGLWLALPKASLVACRRMLFENGVSLQELFSQIIVMMENKDPRIKSILESAKTEKFANKKRQLVFTNPKAIYAALGENDPLKDKKE